MSKYLCDSSLAQDNLDRTSLVNEPGLICAVYSVYAGSPRWPASAGCVGYVWKVTGDW